MGRRMDSAAPQLLPLLTSRTLKGVAVVRHWELMQRRPLSQSASVAHSCWARTQEPLTQVPPAGQVVPLEQACGPPDLPAQQGHASQHCGAARILLSLNLTTCRMRTLLGLQSGRPPMSSGMHSLAEQAAWERLSARVCRVE